VLTVRADIQPANIFIKFRDRSLIESLYLANCPVPKQDRNESRYTPIRSSTLRFAYFTEEDYFNNFEVALGDWGVARWATPGRNELIQPLVLRAPEILIGAPWDEKVDWWNLGALVLEMHLNKRLFAPFPHPDHKYDRKEHLHQIVQLLGPFPKEFLEKGDPEKTMGIFDEDGNIVDPHPSSLPPLNSEAYMPDMEQGLRDELESLIRAMMKINPQERPSAKELLTQPWLCVGDVITVNKEKPTTPIELGCDEDSGEIVEGDKDEVVEKSVKEEEHAATDEVGKDQALAKGAKDEENAATGQACEEQALKECAKDETATEGEGTCAMDGLVHHETGLTSSESREASIA
jgi:serine/threonine protein kinase